MPLSVFPPVAMATAIWILVSVVGWAAFVGALLAVLTVAKRGDAAGLGETCEHTANARSERLGWLVRDVHGVLGVDAFNCGDGNDVVYAGAGDTVGADCERTIPAAQ